MRVRKKKHGAERLLACAPVMAEKPESPIADSFRDFGCHAPLYLEIGCGKGDFACGMAKKHPDRCFYAMEKIGDVLVIAGEKTMALEQRPENLRFCRGDAAELLDWFREASLSGIYLNFSDPWPKKGHQKRRLTHRAFLSLYLKLLKPGARIVFKTDNVALFDFTLEELSSLGLTPLFQTRDLHRSPLGDGNVMTEYERNFSSQGYPIHALAVERPR